MQVPTIYITKNIMYSRAALRIFQVETGFWFHVHVIISLHGGLCSTVAGR